MRTYEYELLRFRQQDALRAAEKYRPLNAIRAMPTSRLRIELGHLMVRLGQWLEGRRAVVDQPITFRRYRSAH